MAGRPAIHVRILGQDFRISSDGSAASEEQIQASAALVDETMRRIRDRTGTVDTLHVAVLAALNLAHRYLVHREQAPGFPPGAAIDPDRVRALIELVESVSAREVAGAA
jgi:hypothetical protein